VGRTHLSRKLKTIETESAIACTAPWPTTPASRRPQGWLPDVERSVSECQLGVASSHSFLQRGRLGACGCTDGSAVGTFVRRRVGRAGRTTSGSSTQELSRPSWPTGWHVCLYNGQGAPTRRCPL
jgi:hypothetical protein